MERLILRFINLPFDDESLAMKECLTIHDIFISKGKNDHLYSYQEIAKRILFF